MAISWDQRLTSLIRKHKTSDDLVVFRNTYREVVSQAETAKRIDSTQAALLLAAREYLEDWVGDSPPDQHAAFVQWSKLYEAGKSRLPGALIEAFLRRFPVFPGSSPDWTPLILDAADSGLIDALLDRRQVSIEQLNQVARAQTADFYLSVALDVLIARSGLTEPRAIWDECVKGKARAGGLLSCEEVAVRCYSLLPAAEANDKMLRHLAEQPARRERLLTVLLDYREPAIQLARHVFFGLPPETQGSGSNSQMRDSVSEWLKQCESEMQRAPNERTSVASKILALARVSYLCAVEGTRKIDSKCAEIARRASEQGLVNVLQTTESQTAGDLSGFTLTVLGPELYAGVQEYLHRLPVGSRRGDESPERALRHERYLGSKQVIEQVLSALDEPLSDGALRDALEVALFNCGVRTVCEVGEQVAFDPRLHETEIPGVLPEDRVIVTSCGRCLGKESERLVLVRARVRPASTGDENQTTIQDTTGGPP